MTRPELRSPDSCLPWTGHEKAVNRPSHVRLSSSATILLPYLFNFMVKKLERGQYNLFLALPTYGACVHRRCTVTERQRFQTWHDRGAWWAAVHGVTKSRTRLHFHFHFSLLCTGEGNATHSSVLAWRIPGTGEPGGLLSLGSPRVGHDGSNLAAVAAQS